MDPLDRGDGPPSLLLAAEGGHAYEHRGALQASRRVLLVAGVLGDPRHNQGVQRLEEQRADAADEHGPEVGVHLSGDTVGVEEGGLGVGHGRRGLTAQADGAPHVVGDVAPDGAGQRPEQPPRCERQLGAERSRPLQRGC